MRAKQGFILVTAFSHRDNDGAPVWEPRVIATRLIDEVVPTMAQNTSGERLTAYSAHVKLHGDRPGVSTRETVEEIFAMLKDAQ